MEDGVVFDAADKTVECLRLNANVWGESVWDYEASSDLEDGAGMILVWGAQD